MPENEKRVLGGTDAHGNYRYVTVPAGVSDDEAHELVEWALEPPFGRMYPITWSEIKKMAKASGREG